MELTLTPSGLAAPEASHSWILQQDWDAQAPKARMLHTPREHPPIVVEGGHELWHHRIRTLATVLTHSLPKLEKRLFESLRSEDTSNLARGQSVILQLSLRWTGVQL